MLCGAGPLEHELRARAQAVGAAVRFHGYAAPAELPRLYAGADVLALASTYEPFGVTLREGAAAGLPLLCSRRAGAAGDVAVEGENALLVDPEDVGEIAGALRRLVREPTLRELFATGSRMVTERHPAEADVEAWERAILRAVGERRRAGVAAASGGPARAGASLSAAAPAAAPARPCCWIASGAKGAQQRRCARRR